MTNTTYNCCIDNYFECTPRQSARQYSIRSPPLPEARVLGNAPPPLTRTSSSKGKSLFKSAFGNHMKKSKATSIAEQSSVNELSMYLTFHVDYEEGDDFDVLK
ncbi:unnamed protein product [Cuscuta epithymum]|uniref:Uncharacterized protein n=1 Tax=Cuscuta epithymum TaxID=186058 RepID=A0AAV0F6A8_9ASTE|nr:unnamed protein product [Cuscuta epithymum]